jgi:hypothetical protein
MLVPVVTIALTQHRSLEPPIHGNRPSTITIKGEQPCAQP